MASAIQPKEPPQPLNHFFVGQDNRGCWTVRDERNLVGGCFVSKDAAIHFARQGCDLHGRKPAPESGPAVWTSGSRLVGCRRSGPPHRLYTR